MSDAVGKAKGRLITLRITLGFEVFVRAAVAMGVPGYVSGPKAVADKRTCAMGV